MYNLPLWYSLVSGQLCPILLSAIFHAVVVTMWKLGMLKDELTPQYATNYIWNRFYQLMCVADVEPQVVVVQPWKLYEFTALFLKFACDYLSVRGRHTVCAESVKCLVTFSAENVTGDTLKPGKGGKFVH